MMRTRRYFAWELAALLSCVGKASAQPLASQGIGMRGAVNNPASIPRVGPRRRPFKTYTLFVTTQRSGLRQVSQSLSTEFDQFGVDIGEDNLAIFVADPATGILDVSAGRMFIELVSRNYRMSLDPARGPFALLLPRHPTEAPQPGEHAVVVEFATASPEQVTASLASLRHEISKQRGRQTTAAGGGFWESVLQGFNAASGGSARVIISS